MDINKMLEWFDLLQDQFGGVYYDEDHKLDFLNTAQLEYVLDLFPSNNGGLVDIEYNSNILENISPLVFEIKGLKMDTNSRVSIADLTTQLVNISGDSDAKVLKIMSVEYNRAGKKFNCNYLRHNDKAKFEANYFKKPSKTSPKYTLNNNFINFRPYDDIPDIDITVVKSPVKMSVSPQVNCELPINAHKQIVSYALEFSGIASRDSTLYEMNKDNKGT